MSNPEIHICKGCNNSFTGTFCNVCGQKVIPRFSLRYLWGLIREDLLEFDKGLWYTMKGLTLQPDVTIKSYLDGNTKKYFSPVKYLLIVAAAVYILMTISGVLQSQADDSFAFETWKDKVLSKERSPFSLGDLADLMNIFPFIMKDYLVAYFLLMLPFVAFAGHFVFRNLNFTELLITWIYLWAHLMYGILAFSFLIAPVILIDSESMTGFAIIMTLYAILIFYFFTKTFKGLTGGKWISSFIKVVVTMYGGFFTFFGLAWVVLEVVKWAYQG